MSDDKNASDLSEVREALEELSSDVTKKDIINPVRYDKNRRLTMRPVNRPKKFEDSKLSDEGSSNGEPEDEDTFDIFILDNFSPFSGNEDVIEWLDLTDEKFNSLKLSRKLRCFAIPLLVKGEAKRAYIINKNKINSYDDFYSFLLSQYQPINHNLPLMKSQPSASILNQSNLIEDASVRKNVVFDEKPKMSASTFELDDSLPHAPILRSTALPDLGATSLTGDDPVNRSDFSLPQNTYLNSSVLDQTTYALRRAIVDSFIKHPKIFRGSKDDVKHWLEEIEQLFDTAQIPDKNKLDLVQYSLKGEASRWFKINKSTFTSWKAFVQGLKETFISPFFEEIAFKRLDSYTQGVNQSVRSFYNEVVKLCNEVDSSMSDFTKLRNLLNKAKPTLQLEIRRKKPTTTKEFLQYAIEVEELFRLSNINLSDDPNKGYNNSQSTSAVTPSRSTNPSTVPNKNVPRDTNQDSNYDSNYEDNNNNDDTCYQTQSAVPSNTNNQQYYQSDGSWNYNNSSKTPYYSNHKKKNRSRYKNNNYRNNNYTQNNNHNNHPGPHDTIANIPSPPKPNTPAPSSEYCSRCQQAGHQVSACPHF